MPIFETATGSRLDLVLPDTHWPELQKAVESYRDLLMQRRVAAARLDTLNDERIKALEADRAALAKAIRAKKPDPGSGAVEKIDKEIVVCKRRFEALDVAIEQAELDLLAAIEENRETWIAETEESVESVSRKFEETIEPMNAARLELASLRSLRNWLTRFPDEQASYRHIVPSIQSLLAPSGDPYQWGQLVEALIAEVHPKNTTPVVIPWGRAADESLRRDA
jgi:chromosome segregation ATPase